MPSDGLKVEICGKVEEQRKLEQVVRDLRGDEFLDAMRTSTLWVQADANASRRSIPAAARQHHPRDP